MAKELVNYVIKYQHDRFYKCRTGLWWWAEKIVKKESCIFEYADALFMHFISPAKLYSTLLNYLVLVLTVVYIVIAHQHYVMLLLVTQFIVLVKF